MPAPAPAATGASTKATAAMRKSFGALSVSSRMGGSAGMVGRAQEADKRLEERARQKAEAEAAAAAAAAAARQAEKEKEAAKREAVRAAAQAAGEKVLARQAEVAAKAAAEKESKARQKASLKVKLWARCRKAAEMSGLNKNGDPIEEYPDLRDVSVAAERLRTIVVEARRAQVADCEKVASKAYKAAVRKATALERSAALLEGWRRQEIADAELEAAMAGGGHLEAAAAASQARAAKALEAAIKADAAAEAAEATAAAKREAAEAKREAAAAGRGAPGSAPAASAPAAASAAAATAAALGTHKAAAAPAASTSTATPALGRWKTAITATVAVKSFQQGRSVPVPSLLAEALQDLPPRIPVPQPTIAAMRASLSPVLHALNHDLDDKLELEAARNAFGSWHKTSWLDSRTNTLKSKPLKGWTCEQYGLNGFAGLYAKKLHVARVAAIRQVGRLPCSASLSSAKSSEGTPRPLTTPVLAPARIHTTYSHRMRPALGGHPSPLATAAPRLTWHRGLGRWRYGCLRRRLACQPTGRSRLVT